MRRSKTYTLNEVLPFVSHVSDKMKDVQIYDNKNVRMNSLRLRLFAKKGTKCVTCGINGTYFALEQHEDTMIKNPTSWHFNLYGINSNGEEILITKDHILAKSKGGLDRLENFQTMCYPCNQQKSNN